MIYIKTIAIFWPKVRSPNVFLGFSMAIPIHVAITNAHAPITAAASKPIGLAKRTSATINATRPSAIPMLTLFARSATPISLIFATIAFLLITAANNTAKPMTINTPSAIPPVATITNAPIKTAATTPPIFRSRSLRALFCLPLLSRSI